MCTDKKYDYEGTRAAFRDRHIYTVGIEELRKYLSGVTADDVGEALQPRADRMASVICSLINSKIAEQNHKKNMNSLESSQIAANSARIAAWVASIAVCLQVLLQIVKLICTQQ